MHKLKLSLVLRVYVLNSMEQPWNNGVQIFFIVGITVWHHLFLMYLTKENSYAWSKYTTKSHILA